jgi:hypothetical protein
MHANVGAYKHCPSPHTHTHTQMHSKEPTILGMSKSRCNALHSENAQNEIHLHQEQNTLQQT